ncbi:vWA domain-containing protein [Polymorphum gilvum]|uniref:IMP dehydrogenase/GMP reductase, VWA containing CoxE-like protein n=1 Tax=Polymorphum gilvum (strain LMG 25793 / CGMCC 1.9160 / SL003B-26A1) TaxID=991905 RepID=F2J4Y9_POLGS|nr:VWA domain-containing protein [Polymorphum gilvum]ADZ70031.1 IMP dehydrogenase/GMP reductase, VWA containing CoxE-like protein [Polymorphum gilvum SL003B-26A1]
MAGAATDAHGRIVDNIVHFARTLRRAGLPAGPASVVDAVRAVEVSGIESRDDLYWTLHAVFVRKREHRVLFDEAFRIYWQSRGLIEKMLAILSPVAPPRGAPEKPKAGQTRVSQAFKAARERKTEQTEPEVEVDARFTVSGRELLQTRDFAQMTAAEIEAAKAALRRMVMPMDKVRRRRLSPAPRGLVDPRRSMRASLRAGGAIIDLKFRRPQEKRPPLVALCDISGSMSQYTRVLLHFLHALTEQRRDVHTFLFGTRLTNVTRQLRMKDPDEALAACSAGVEDWSGGTRIATALHAFNRTWSRRVLSGGPTVLLITDGLERDTDEDLEREMDRLHRSCRRLIWLNPLLRFDGFEAKAKGIRAMLPHVDEFRAVHSLDAVADLIASLSADGGTTAGDTDPRTWLRRSA